MRARDRVPQVRNFSSLGAIEPRLIEYTRAPGPSDKKDPSWRPWNATKDALGDAAIRTGTDYFDAVTPADEAFATNPAALYYWRSSLSTPQVRALMTAA